MKDRKPRARKREGSRKGQAAGKARVRPAKQATRGARKRAPMGRAKTAVRGTVVGVAAAVRRRLPGASRQPDALTYLTRDHRRIEKLLKDGEATTDRAVKRRATLLRTLMTELGFHEMLEEILLYPALKAHPEATDIVLEGYQEHHVADLIVRELDALAADAAQWGAKFRVLKENIEHHIQEEEGEMFRTARAVMRRDELQALGEEMRRLRRSEMGKR